MNIVVLAVNLMKSSASIIVGWPNTNNPTVVLAQSWVKREANFFPRWEEKINMELDVLWNF